MGVQVSGKKRVNHTAIGYKLGSPTGMTYVLSGVGQTEIPAHLWQPEYFREEVS